MRSFVCGKKSSNRVMTTQVSDVDYVAVAVLPARGALSFFCATECTLTLLLIALVFAWKTSPRFRETFGLLAEDPADFRNSGDIVPYEWNSEPFAMTNKGLRTTLESTESQSRMILPCAPAEDSRKLVAMHVRKVDRSANQYLRVNLTALDPCTFRGPACTMYFPQHINGTNKLPIPVHAFSLKVAHHGTDPAQKQALPVDACAVRDYRAPSTGFSDLEDTNRSNLNSTADIDLVESLCGRTSPKQLYLPAWNTGLWIVILFERELPKPSKSKAHFVLLLGTSENGDLGHCIQPFTLQGTRIGKDHRSRYLFKPEKNQSRLLPQPWYPRDFAGQFSPQPLNKPSTAWIDFYAAGSSVTGRSSGKVICSESVTVALEGKPEEARKENEFTLEMFDGVLEIRVSISRLSPFLSRWRQSRMVHAKEGLAASARSGEEMSEDRQK